MSEQEKPVTMEYMEAHGSFRYSRPGYRMPDWPSSMYVGGKDGDAFLYIDGRPLAAVRTKGDVRRIVEVFTRKD